MVKSVLVKNVAEKLGVTQKEANAAIDAVFGEIAEAIKVGDKITIPGFGTFSVSERAARKGRNPQTGAEIDIAASRSGKFSPGKDLKGL